MLRFVRTCLDFASCVSVHDQVAECHIGHVAHDPVCVRYRTNGSTMTIAKHTVLDQHVGSIILNGNIVVASRKRATTNCDISGGQQILLVLQRRVPWLTVRANATDFKITALFHRLVTVIDRAVYNAHVLYVVPEGHTNLMLHVEIFQV
eukprot:SAG31_NODE_3556_length_4126_cov_1.701266_3_plen_149_part_00